MRGNKNEDGTVKGMKLLLVVSSLSEGGAQRVASNLMVGLAREDHVDILLNDTEDITYPYKGRIFDLGFKAEADKGKLLYQLKVFCKRFYRLSSLKRKENYDAVISFLDSANIVNILTGKKNSKVVVTVHSKLSASGFDWRYKYIVFPLVRLLYDRADYVVAVSKGVEEDLRHKLGCSGKNLMTIYNGFEFDRIRLLAEEKISLQEQEFFMSEQKVIVAVGRLCKAKGFWHLIRAFNEIAYKHDAKLLIIGDGEQKNYLKNLSRDLGLEKKIKFMGFVNNPFKYIRASDIFVMSSLYEGLPSSLIEALVLNKPCIATDF